MKLVSLQTLKNFPLLPGGTTKRLILISSRIIIKYKKLLFSILNLNTRNSMFKAPPFKQWLSLVLLFSFHQTFSQDKKDSNNEVFTKVDVPASFPGVMNTLEDRGLCNNL